MSPVTSASALLAPPLSGGAAPCVRSVLMGVKLSAPRVFWFDVSVLSLLLSANAGCVDTKTCMGQKRNHMYMYMYMHIRHRSQECRSIGKAPVQILSPPCLCVCVRILRWMALFCFCVYGVFVWVFFCGVWSLVDFCCCSTASQDPLAPLAGCRGCDRGVVPSDSDGLCWVWAGRLGYL